MDDTQNRKCTRCLNAHAFRGMLTDVRGATAIEYALIASSVSVFILTGVTALGSSIIENFYDKITALF